MKLKRLIVDKKGKVILFQPPNAALIVAVTSIALALLLPEGTAQNVFSLGAFGTSFTWGWLELLQGVTLLRRLLGALVLGILLTAFV